jgi:hypothetical protein
MDSLKTYDDLKFAIRCVDIWKQLKPSDAEMEDVLKYEADEKSLDPKTLFCQNLQDYLEMLIAMIQNETGEWFFYVDITGVLYDFVATDELSVYKTESGYCVCFKK